MTIRLYDLVGRDDRRFSSNCCKTLYALAHKGLACETVPTRFTDISSIGDGSFSTIPVIEDGDTRLGDSWEIAMYLEATYPDAPSLFGGAAGIEYARFIARWVETRTHPLVMTMIVHDIYEGLDPADQPYFWESRTKRLGRPIDEVPVGREDRLPELRARLEPIRRIVADQLFLGGTSPIYADYVAMASFIWARKTSPFALVDAGDPVHAWMHRCLDLYGGLLRQDTDYDW
ncbi:MAG: glutathione S-transferase family protein [Rhodospirillaceae bacterium]|nr:glutathione S-transferase family protein [Rhodospirillaceae bacterium]MBT4773753.1 glutathione S-transferase family protein [Rhodospirillaceae bacterium]MBT5357591.1 glutathione S-transferase family protein [Rhodospirillaceae bacterium]MBT5770580.1 glutathione S-transferase family protein [Rhodospirillaceae bacterium]MBT6308649.1 glutathione S-transferase family protein [Rhodospirillaceae bacterium]